MSAPHKIVDGEEVELTQAELEELQALQLAMTPTIDDFRRAIQAHIDASAGQRGYDNGASCVSYLGSTNPTWASEAMAFAAWRDDVWTYAYAELAKVQAGERAQPDIAAFIAELPALVWPAA